MMNVEISKGSIGMDAKVKAFQPKRAGNSYLNLLGP